MYDTASELYNELPETYFDEYNDFSEDERSKMDPKYYPTNFTFDVYDYEEWYKEKLDDLTVKGDKEEVKEEAGMKILTSNKLLSRLPVLLAKIKAGNNSYKQKMKSDKQCIYFIITIKSPKNFTIIKFIRVMRVHIGDNKLVITYLF